MNYELNKHKVDFGRSSFALFIMIKDQKSKCKCKQHKKKERNENQKKTIERGKNCYGIFEFE